jgi:ribosome maturation factor RimP
MLMRSVDIVEQIKAIAGRVAGTHGLELFDVQYRREASGLVVRVRLDRPGPAATPDDSVSVEDCARVSRELSAILDVEDIVPAEYILEVSSPGLDRPLRHLDDYRRFTGRLAKVVLREPVDGQTFLRGRLGGVAEGEPGRIVIVSERERRHVVPIDVISRANLEVEF